MKGFFFFLLLVAVAVGGYLYWPQIQEQLGGTPEGDVPPVGTQPAAPAVATTSNPAPPAPTPPRPAPAPAPTPESAPTPEPAPEPEPDDSEKLPGPTDEELAEMFPLPVFEPLTAVVKNWTEIPASAFPRAIIARKAVDFVLAGGVGKSTVPPGQALVAVSIEGEILTVSPREGSSVSGKIGIDDTNLKEVLEKAYEGYKKRKEREVLAKRAAERRRQLAPYYAKKAADAAFQKMLGAKPEAADAGWVKAMVDSIKAKEVTEITPDVIDSWGPVVFEEIDGEPYWVGSIRYKASTVFGTFPAEALALMRNDKVVKWIYAGSHEPVP